MVAGTDRGGPVVTLDRLRRLVSECRADREKVMVSPEVLEVLLDIAENSLGGEDVVAAVQRAPKAA